MSKSLLKAVPSDVNTEPFNFADSLRPVGLVNLQSHSTVNSSNMANLAIQLEGFIRRSLQQSYCSCYSADERLKILDHAWKAQKLRWDIRRIWQV